MQFKYDVAVAYRVYPGISKSPFIYADNKYELVKRCAKSLKNALGDVKAKIYVLLDGCPNEYSALFSQIFADKVLTIMNFHSVGNFQTFKQQVELLSTQTDAPYVYLAEDDYIYKPDSFAKMLAFLQQPGVDFLTPYDHLDYYSSQFHRNKLDLDFFAGHHWRSANSTTLTFLTDKKTLISAQKVLLSYTRGCHDCSMWMSLTKKIINNPYYLLKYGFKDAYLIKLALYAWKYNWIQILFGDKYTLWSAVPALATHAESTCLAPGVNWAEFFPLEE